MPQCAQHPHIQFPPQYLRVLLTQKPQEALSEPQSLQQALGICVLPTALMPCAFLTGCLPTQTIRPRTMNVCDRGWHPASGSHPTLACAENCMRHQFLSSVTQEGEDWLHPCTGEDRETQKERGNSAWLPSSPRTQLEPAPRLATQIMEPVQVKSVELLVWMSRQKQQNIRALVEPFGWQILCASCLP